MANLPQDIIVEILTWLPVKSLCRFRCVSKPWRFLISNPDFIKSHLDRALQNKHIYSQRQRLIFSSQNLWSIEYESIGNDSGEAVAVELDYPLKDEPNKWAELMGCAKDGLLYCKATDDAEPMVVKLDSPFTENSRNWVEIFGSCNGLVCIAPDEDTLYLFNPAIGDSKRIPNPPAEFPVGPYNGITVYGFGYDSINDDYKVVKLVAGENVCLYSLRTNSWSWIGISPYECNVYEPGMHLNGAIHWVVSHGEGMDYKCVVAAFDLAEEWFWDIPAPDIVDANDEFVVGVLNGCLCILHNRNQMHDDFWVMLEYGVSESWTRVTISTSYICMKPVCFAKSGEALLEIDGKLVLCNLEDNTSRDLVVRSVPTGVGFEADTYIESLVSPNGYFGDGIPM